MSGPRNKRIQTMAYGTSPANPLALLTLDGEAFVRQAYRALLGRPADAEALRLHLGRLQSGVPKEQILADLEATPEGRLAAHRRRLHAGGTSSRHGSDSLPQSVDDLLAVPQDHRFIAHAYSLVLGRPADTEGFTHYQRLLASGANRAQVLRDLAKSKEAQAYGHRLPGLASWLKRSWLKRSSKTTRVKTSVQPASALAASAPAAHVSALLAAADDRAFLEAAYLQLLGRPIDAEGLTTHAQLLRQGWSRSYVVRELHRSPEGQQAGITLAGLQIVITRYSKAQRRSWSGWYWRHVKGVESDLPRDREMRAIYRHLADGMHKQTLF